MQQLSATARHRLGHVCILAALLVSYSCLRGITYGDEPPTLDSQPSIKYSIVVTGNELLSGVYADGHTLYITKTLRPLGLHCVGSVSVDDREEDICGALQFTLPRSELIIVTGGLGPTESDITRDVLSTFTKKPLREHPAVLQQLEQRFHTSRDQLRANLRRQTRVPVQGTYLPNDSGTAVGLVFGHGNKVIVALPGPPRELQPMVRDQLIPYLAKRFGLRTAGCSLTMRFVGLGQSQIDQTLRDQIQLAEDVMQTSQFDAGRVDFTFSLPDNSSKDRQRLEQLRKDLYTHLGDNIYADNATTTLEEAAIERLERRKQTLALVELGSGGTLSAGFAQAARGRNVLAGAFIASRHNQLQRILQIPDDDWTDVTSNGRLELIAKAARQRVQSDWAIVVGAPKAVPRANKSRILVLILTPDGAWTQEFLPWTGSSKSNLNRLETHFFDLLRRVT